MAKKTGITTLQTFTVASPEPVQDVLQRLVNFPEGTHGAHAVDLLIADGALSTDLRNQDPKRARRLFQQRVGQWVRKAVAKGTFPAEYILFENKKGATTARNLDIETAIITHLDRVGALSLRGVYYFLLPNGLVGRAKKDYQRLSGLLTNMREAGRLDPDLIIDDTTSYEGFWGRSLTEHIEAFDLLEVDPFDDQETRLEVWVEKATVMQNLQATFNEYRVAALPVHGNFHFGAAHQVAKKIIERGQNVHALYLGDWDPTGLNIVGMDGDGVIKRRMTERLSKIDGGDPDMFRITRIGLTEDDIESDTLANLWVEVKDNERAERTYQETGKGPRRGDPNAERYKARFGRKAWEVDALIATDPDALRERVGSTILRWRDEDTWDTSIETETTDQAWLTTRVNRLKADARRRS